MVVMGLAGVFSFAIGGTLVLFLLTQTLQGYGPSGEGFSVFSFTGLLLTGLGLFMIVQDGKAKDKI